MKNKKKLPLPAGANTVKTKKKTYFTVALGLVILLGLIGYFGALTKTDATSTRAFLSGNFIEIRVPSQGHIEYIAKTGQPVKAGEAVLKMDTSSYEKAAKDAEAVVSSKAATIPPRSRELMLRYLAIPQSEAELDESVLKASAAEKIFKDELDEFTKRQATFGLELRRLELKHGKLPEEETRMESMRVEEEFLRESLQGARDQFETASLERAATEKRLQSKREFGRALRSLPGTQREQLYALETEFYKMYEAGHEIALASVNSPKSGKVMFTKFSPGDYAKEGDTAFYMLPGGKLNVWVTAYFSTKDARKIQLGMPCTVLITGSSPISAQGTVAERLPHLETGQVGETPFKVLVDELETDQLIGLAPEESIVVKLGQ